MDGMTIFFIISIIIFIVGVGADAISRGIEQKKKIKLPDDTEKLHKQ